MEVPSALWLIASHNLNRQCLVGAAAGFLSHVLYFIRGYHDTQALAIFVVHAVLLASMVAALAAAGSGLYGSLWRSLAVFASYLAALFTSIAIYRVFFHRLSRFPGPLAAKLTKFYGLYTARNGQTHLEQNKLFKKYGDIVRIGPNELLILSTDAIPKIHTGKNRCTKHNVAIYSIIHYKGEPNLDSIMDQTQHRWRRQVWERSMTTKALHIYEDSTRQVCHTWLQKVASLEGSPIDMSLFARLITFDHMGKIGFSHDFKTLEAGKEPPMLRLLEVMFGQAGKLGELVWPIAFLQSLGVGGDAAKFDELARQMADRRLTTHQENASPDILGHLIEDFRSEKPVAFFNKNILYSDASVILVGATDTIGVVLSYAFYRLSAHPHHQTRLYEEVAKVFGKTAPGEFTNNDLASIEHLDAVINETMRMDNSGCNNAPRLTPPEGIVVDGVWIPGESLVRVPGHGIKRSAKAFVDPDDFIPERWTTRPELVLDRAAFFPFLIGPNNCVGKRLAMMVLRLVLSYTVYYYQFEFAPGEDGTAIHREARNHVILKAGPLRLAFTKRA